MKNIRKRQEGITLIALVITIIVLLILSGITISMLSGENGILGQAEDAKTKTEKESIEEKIKLAAIDALIDGNDLTKIEDMEHLNKALQQQGLKGITVTENGTEGYKVLVEEVEYNVTLNAVVTKSEPVTGPLLAEEVTIGDYVNYIAKSGENYTSHVGEYETGKTIEQKVATFDANGSPKGIGIQGNGYEEQTFTVPLDTNSIEWRVIGIENGQVQLTSAVPLGKNGVYTGTIGEGLNLRGVTGYVYGANELDNICAIYGTGLGVASVRSLIQADIDGVNGDEYRGMPWMPSWGESNGTTIPYVIANRIKWDDYRYAISGCVDAGGALMIEYYSGPNEDYSAYVEEWRELSREVGYRPVITLNANVIAGKKTTENNKTIWDMSVPK